MKKTLTVLIALGILTSVTNQAKAESVDARSVALGGTTLGTSNGAFAPLRNPAGMMDLGWGSFILPLSPSFSLGNNVSGFNSFIPSSGANTQDLLKEISKNLSNNSGSSRLEVNSTFPILGYSGKPSQDLKIMGQPIALGINLWGKGNAVADFDKTFNQIFGTGIDVFNETQNVQSNVSNITKNFSQSNFKIPNLSGLTSGNSGAIEEVENLQTTVLKPVVSSSDDIIKSLDSLDSTLNNFVSSLEKLNDQTGKGRVFADGHAVIAVSGASRVFANDMVDVSAGVNLKGFFFPSNPAVNPLNTALGVNSPNPKLFPLTFNPTISLGQFKTTDQLKTLVNGDLKTLTDTAKNLLDNAKQLDSLLDTAIPKYKEGGVTAVTAEAIQGQQLVTEIQSDFSQISSLQTNLESLQSSLVEDFNNVGFSYDQVTDIAPFGFGADIGVQARIKDDAVVGLVLENPLVLWPGKSKTNNVKIDASQLNGTTGSVDVSKLFKIDDSGEEQSINYNYTEPFAVRLGGAYNLGKLTPVLSDASVMADVEQVFNGRPFALHLGFEKSWYFSKNRVSARIGGQVGGLGSLISLGAGGQFGPFAIDLGVGTSNPNILNANTAVFALSTALNF